jgi:LmbE family N-acetylglucosaminyl deacetylase
MLTRTGMFSHLGIHPGATILFVFTHPDDEILAAATIAQAKAEGYHVVVITLTLGEGGLTPAGMTAQMLANKRSMELAIACQALGGIKLITFDLPDSKELLDYSIEEILETIRPEVETLNPALIVSFPDNGFTGHGGHIHTAKLARAMHERFALAGAQLWAMVPTHVWATLDTDTFMYEGTVLEIPAEAELVFRLVVEFPWLWQKQRAFLAHNSQGESLQHIHPALGVEAFVLLATK